MSAAGQWPWLGEWLFQVVLDLVREAAGDIGIALWRALWSAAALALALGVAYRLNARGWATLMMAVLALAVMRERLAARPEQVTLGLLLLFVLVFERARSGGPDRTAWLVPLQALWVNLHVMWILGPLIAWTYAGAAGWLEDAGRRRALAWAGLGVVLLLASAITPRPLDILTLRIVRDLNADPTRSVIHELRAWSWPEDLRQAFTFFVVAAALATALGGRAAWRRSPALCLIGLGGLAAGMLTYRLRALGVMAALPSVAVALESEYAGVRGRLASAVAVAAGLAGLVVLLATSRFYPPGVAPDPVSVPVCSVALADSLGLEGTVLNTSWYGGYILWIRGESHPPLVDTRNLGTAAFRSRFVRAYDDSAALDTLLSQWRCTHAILEPPQTPEDRRAILLARRPDWSLVFADDAGLLLVKRSAYPTLAAARSYRLLTPDYQEMARRCSAAMADTALARALVAELERARAESPWHARASLWLGAFELARDRPHLAAERLDEAYRLAPLLPGLALRRGLAHQRIGEREVARAAFKQALREPADAAAARQALEELQ